MSSVAMEVAGKLLAPEKLQKILWRERRCRKFIVIRDDARDFLATVTMREIFWQEDLLAPGTMKEILWRQRHCRKNFGTWTMHEVVWHEGRSRKSVGKEILWHQG